MENDIQWLNKLLRWIPLVPVARVDYIWYTNSIKSLACWVGEDAGSDHLPVLAKMEIFFNNGLELVIEKLSSACEWPNRYYFINA